MYFLYLHFFKASDTVFEVIIGAYLPLLVLTLLSS